MNYGSLDDGNLLYRVAGGDELALEAIYDRYSRLVFSVAMHLVGERTAAEEVTLDVFTRLWQNAADYDPARAQLSTWLTSVLDSCGAWEDAEGWRDRMANEVDAVVRAVRKTTATVVAVSDEVGWSVVPESPSGRLFREALGSLNQRLAAESERVLLVVAGRVVDLSRGFS